jgi:hypothetical protein
MRIKSRTSRRRGGKVLALFGGYVSWDGRGKDDAGFPLRTSREVRVWLRADLVDDDCGPDTAELVAALEAAVGPRKNITVSESWRY